jgi:hypothetical protein
MTVHSEGVAVYKKLAKGFRELDDGGDEIAINAPRSSSRYLKPSVLMRRDKLASSEASASSAVLVRQVSGV